MKPWLLALLCAPFVTLLACRASDAPTTKCEGRDLYICDPLSNAPLVGDCPWRHVETCAGACISWIDGAFCTIGDEPSPRCPPLTKADREVGRHYVEQHCEGDVLTECRDGYLVGETTCDVACVHAPAYANFVPQFCALSPEPNPACVAMSSTCIDGALVGCHEGFVVWTATCDAGESCRITRVPAQYDYGTTFGEAACGE